MHKHRIFLATGLAASLALGLAFARPRAPESRKETAAAELVVDPVHSSAWFRIKHANASWSTGAFNTLAGSVVWDAAAPEKSSVSITIDVGSVDTNNAQRDEHLRSPDFFDAKQFPTATFKSTKVVKKDKALAVTGDFTLHGVTKSITADVEHVGTGKGPQGGEVTGFSAKVTLQRSEFGIKTYPGMLGEEVTLLVDLECAKK